MTDLVLDILLTLALAITTVGVFLLVLSLASLLRWSPSWGIRQLAEALHDEHAQRLAQDEQRAKVAASQAPLPGMDWTGDYDTDMRRLAKRKDRRQQEQDDAIGRRRSAHVHQLAMDIGLRPVDTMDGEPMVPFWEPARTFHDGSQLAAWGVSAITVEQGRLEYLEGTVRAQRRRLAMAEQFIAAIVWQEGGSYDLTRRAQEEAPHLVTSYEVAGGSVRRVVTRNRPARRED